MRILVTGANGYIASNLTRHLVFKKYRVTALEQESCDFDRLKDLNGAIDIVKVRNDLASISGAVKKSKPDVVAHLAALTLVEDQPEQVQQLLTSNIVFPTLLAEAMLKNGVKRMVNTGSFWEYAKAPGQYNPLNLYAASKSAFEQILRYYEHAYSFRCVTLKLYGVYGPLDPRGRIFSFLKQSINAKQPVSFSWGRQRLDLIYLEDVLCAFEKAIRYVSKKSSSSHEIFFIGSGKSVQLRKIARIFESCAGEPLNIRWGGRPYRPKEIMESRADIGPAMRRLGWRPRYDLENGIKKMLKTEGMIQK